MIELANVTKALVERAKEFHSKTEEIPESLRFLHRRILLLVLVLQEIEDQIRID